MSGGWIYRHGGNEYWLVYTADAYFEIRERYGTDLFDGLRADDRSGFDIAVGCLAILARECELCRRYMGYDALPMLTEEEIRRTVLPDGIVSVKNAVMNAVLSGMRIENARQKDEPIDVGLLEYEKKTEVG